MTNQADTTELFKESLKKHGLKATPQRLAVHRAMHKMGHASADMVKKEIDTEGQVKITVASVYNILSNLSDLGIYGRRMSSTSKMYFDVNTKRHAHLYDSTNDCFKDIMDEELMNLIETRLSKKKFPGYKVDNIDIQVIARPSTRRRKS